MKQEKEGLHYMFTCLISASFIKSVNDQFQELLEYKIVRFYDIQRFVAGRQLLETFQWLKFSYLSLREASHSLMKLSNANAKKR